MRFCCCCAGRYGGFNKARVCPKSYPKSAPEYICSHIAFVEMDGQMSYKQAMAHLATRDAAYANNVLDIVEAWARNNKEWGVQKENGPLEAAWGVAAMARSLEMLKATDMSDDEDLLSKWLNTKRSFVRWYKTVIHPVMEYYVDVITQNALSAGTQTVYGNWHSSIAEAWMAVAVLTDDRTLYDKSLELFDSTVESYFRWGRDKDARDGRIVRECSETLRDLYHSQVSKLVMVDLCTSLACRKPLQQRRNDAVSPLMTARAVISVITQPP